MTCPFKMALLGILVGAALPVMARPISDPHEGALLKAADTAVIGRVVSAIDAPDSQGGGAGWTSDQTVVISVDTPVKGALLRPGEKLTVRAHTYYPVRQGTFAIFFLRHGIDANYTNLAEDSWTLSAKQLFPGRHAAAASPLAAVTREMLAILGSYETDLNNKLTGVNYLYAVDRRTRIDSIYAQAAAAIADAPDDLVEAPLRALARNTNPLISLWATYALVKHGFSDALIGAVPLLMSPTPKTEIAASGTVAHVADGGVPAALAPTLVTLLASRNANIRGEAAMALAFTRADTIGPPLAAAMQAETDVDALHQEARALCIAVQSPLQACLRVALVGWPAEPPSFWRQWAKQRLTP